MLTLAISCEPTARSFFEDAHFKYSCDVRTDYVVGVVQGTFYYKAQSRPNGYFMHNAPVVICHEVAAVDIDTWHAERRKAQNIIIQRAREYGAEVPDELG